MELRFPRFSQGLAQDPTTRRIWFGVATAHDFANFLLLCSNWTWPEKTRAPNNMVGALRKKFWPGYYTPTLCEPKVATTWADYEAAPWVGFHSAADAVRTKFWVRHISRVPFLVDDPTVLTLTLTICFMHDCRNFIVWRMIPWKSRRGRRLCLGLVLS